MTTVGPVRHLVWSRSCEAVGRRAYLKAGAASGTAQGSVQGVEPVDPVAAGGPAFAERVAPSALRVAGLARELEGFRARFGGGTLFPQHNFLDAGVEERCL